MTDWIVCVEPDTWFGVAPGTGGRAGLDDRNWQQGWAATITGAHSDIIAGQQ